MIQITFCICFINRCLAASFFICVVQGSFMALKGSHVPNLARIVFDPINELRDFSVDCVFIAILRTIRKDTNQIISSIAIVTYQRTPRITLKE